MTPERLAEIRQFAEAYKGTGLVRRRPNSAIAHRGELLAEIDRATRKLGEARERQPKVTDVVQLVIPRGPMLDGIKSVLRALGVAMAGPLPLDDEPIPTYVLQPIDAEPPQHGQGTAREGAAT